VAVGHTRDDQAETVLLHILRGSGMRGLAGMSASAAWPLGNRDLRLVRPLLGTSRAQTEACCAAAGLTPIDDLSNRSGENARSRVRQELLPLMRTFNSNAGDALLRLSENAALDLDVLEALAAKAVRKNEEGAVISRRELQALPESLQRHAVRVAAAHVFGANKELAQRHVLAILRSAGATGTQLDLPSGLRSETRREEIVLSRAPREDVLPTCATPLTVPGETAFGPWRLRTELLDRPPPVYPRDGLDAYLDADACGAELVVRRRQPGDRFHPLGLRRPKKLQDFLVDAHIPRSQRDAVPLVCGPAGIALVVGQRPAEWTRVTGQSSRVLHLKARRLDKDPPREYPTSEALQG
jgi:tRNA(Ile)-lysidine synthase